jgi:hypothetical protein
MSQYEKGGLVTSINTKTLFLRKKMNTKVFDICRPVHEEKRIFTIREKRL